MPLVGQRGLTGYQPPRSPSHIHSPHPVNQTMLPQRQVSYPDRRGPLPREQAPR